MKDLGDGHAGSNLEASGVPPQSAQVEKGGSGALPDAMNGAAEYWRPIDLDTDKLRELVAWLADCVPQEESR